MRGGSGKLNNAGCKQKFTTTGTLKEKGEGRGDEGERHHKLDNGWKNEMRQLGEKMVLKRFW